MPSPESGPAGGPTRNDLIKKIKEWFEHLLHKKTLEGEAEKLEKERRKAETSEKRDEAERKRKEEEKEKEFYKRESGQTKVETTDALRQAKREEIKNKLNNFIHQQGSEGSVYNFTELARDENLVTGLKTLIDDSPAAAYLIEDLVDGGYELYSDAASLINISRDLLVAAKQETGGEEAVRPLLSSIEKQVKSLMEDTIREYARQLRSHEVRPNHWLQWFKEKIKYQLTDDQSREFLKALKSNDPGGIDPVIHDLFKTVPAVESTEKSFWADVEEPGREEGVPNPPKKLVEQVDRIWQKLETGIPLSSERLEEVYKDLLKAESSSYPADLMPGSKTYLRAIQASHRLVESKLNAVSAKFVERLKTEKPQVKEGITDTQVFLREMALVRQGSLGELLSLSPEMMKLFVGNVTRDRITESVRFRNQVFLTIHKRILTDPHSSSGENFGLYERADLTSFLNILGSEMAHLTKKETGATYGDAWVEWYTNLSSAIRLSRDIDFYASTPGVAIDDWARSFSLFKNEISSQAIAIPAVEQAYRALETTLRSIRDSNDGYIPPGMVGYDPMSGTSPWDKLAQRMLLNMIDSGVVYDMARDEVGGFHEVDVGPNGRRIKLGKKLKADELIKQDPQGLEMSMYMTLGKGFGLASLRFLEMFANSKVPGSKQPVYAMEHFHSTPYEGPARALNYVSGMLHKWKFGSYKYMQIMNTLLPEGHKIPHMDEKHAMEAYATYLEGSDAFEEKYGEEARRMIDKLNFSGMSSAFGTNYSWRQLDSTIGWSDKQRELLGGPIKILFQKQFAEAKVKEYLVINKYREAFRRKMQAMGQSSSGWEFDALWKERGLPVVQNEIDKQWEKLEKDEKVEKMIAQYKKAFVARSLVETAARNPIAMAHALEKKIIDPLTGKERKVRLHNLIAHEVLGIPPEYTKYGNLYSGQAAVYATPSEEQLQYIKEILSLEGDIAAVREIALAENRELEEADFTIIQDETRCEQAKKYWKLVKEAMFGSENPQDLYKKFGMEIGDNGTDYALDWEKIMGINKTLDGLGKEALLNERLTKKNWEVIIGTDSTAFRQMDLLNLGSRQWVRAAGDAASHFHGGERVGKFLTVDLNTNPDPNDLAKALLEIRQMYEGDNIDVGWKVVSYLTNATGRLYGMDYGRFGSPAQLEVWKTRRNVAAWTANGRRKFIDALEHLDVLPPTADAWGYDIPEGTDIEHLKKFLRADNASVWVEILTLGIMLAFIITIWRAMTAKSEEEEEGGGGGDH